MHAEQNGVIRPLSVDDYPYVSSVVDDWWGGQPVRASLPRLFFEHFQFSSFAVGEGTQLQAFLIGLVSQTDPQIAYIHFVGVHPAARQQQLGKRLYRHFFRTVAARGCVEVHSITSPVNRTSIAFHQKMGFSLMPCNGEIDGIPVTLDYAGEGWRDDDLNAGDMGK